MHVPDRFDQRTRLHRAFARAASSPPPDPSPRSRFGQGPGAQPRSFLRSRRSPNGVRCSRPVRPGAEHARVSVRPASRGGLRVSRRLDWPGSTGDWRPGPSARPLAFVGLWRARVAVEAERERVPHRLRSRVRVPAVDASPRSGRRFHRRNPMTPRCSPTWGPGSRANSGDPRALRRAMAESRSDE